MLDADLPGFTTLSTWILRNKTFRQPRLHLTPTAWE